MSRETIDQVYICITYNRRTNNKTNKLKAETSESESMNQSHNKRDEKPTNGYICSICLNSKTYPKRSSDQTCPLCINRAKSYHQGQRKEHPRKDYANGDCAIHDNESGKHLLNEVLNVFQKKRTNDKTNQKDASVNTEMPTGVTRLSVRNLFTHSIEDKPMNTKCFKSNFIILNSTQPRREHAKNLSILHKKSSSIPQMKLDELKYTLKEKSNSKDVIEEVNRIFATVNRNTYPNKDNRPAVRHGPSILPVFKNDDDFTEHEGRCSKDCKTTCTFKDRQACEKYVDDKYTSGDKHGMACCDDKCINHCKCCSKYANRRQEMCDCCRRNDFSQCCCHD